MRGDGRKCVLVLALIGVASACSHSHSPCGERGRFVNGDDADYCVYASQAMPIVIEGGFSCPAEMRFEADLNMHRVCSDRPFDAAHPPRDLCSQVEGMCGNPAQPSDRPDDATPPAKPDPEHDAGVATDANGVRVWTEGDDCFAATLKDGLTGDRCPTPGTFGCGTTDECISTFAICGPEDILKVSDLQILDCPQDKAAESGGSAPVWSQSADCEAVMRDGRSFQPCDGNFVCAQATDDPCCLEYAFCDDAPPGPENVLYRARICERGCSRVTPDPDHEPVTDCSYFAGEGENESSPDELRRADLPCTGDFMCWNEHDLSSGADGVVRQDLDVLRWCGGGVVRGQHSTLSNLFEPTPKP